MPGRSENISSDGVVPYEVPNPEWTPKQEENWNNYGQDVYDRLETESGRYWYRRTWRPKKQHEGMMKRDHVKFGTPEDYVVAHVEDALNPMGNLTGLMMRKLSTRGFDQDGLQEAIDDITQARIQNIAEHDPDRARRLLADAQQLAQTYGLEPEA